MIRPALCIRWMRQYAGEGLARCDMNTEDRIQGRPGNTDLYVHTSSSVRCSTACPALRVRAIWLRFTPSRLNRTSAADKPGADRTLTRCPKAALGH